MRCPSCNSIISRVVRTTDGATRAGEPYISRRRECISCRARWTTFECYELPDLEAALRIREALSILDKARETLAPL